MVEVAGNQELLEGSSLPQVSRQSYEDPPTAICDERPLGSRLSLLDFLWPGPTGTAATIGETKLTFMSRLGLDERLPYHKALFEQMKDEAKKGCVTLFSGDQEITSAAIDAIERNVFYSACPATRCIYEVVAPAEDNWVIRWMLWHVIESSDTQINACSLLSGLPSPGDDSTHDAPNLLKQVRFDLRSHAHPISPPEVEHERRDYWDPIRSP